MDKKKVLKLKPEIKEFLAIVGLGKYLLTFELCIYVLAMIVCAMLMGEHVDLTEMMKMALIMTGLFDGILLILSTFIDMAFNAAKWLVTRKITLIQIEERNLKIM